MPASWLSSGPDDLRLSVAEPYGILDSNLPQLPMHKKSRRSDQGRRRFSTPSPIDLFCVGMLRTTIWSSRGAATRPRSPKSSCAPALRRENASTERRISGVWRQRLAGRLGGRHVLVDANR